MHWPVRKKPSASTLLLKFASLHIRNALIPITGRNSEMAPKQKKGGNGGGKSADEEREEPLQALVRQLWVFCILSHAANHCSDIGRFL